METNRKSKAIIGISMAAIMVVSVLAVAMPMTVATSDGTNFNTISGSGTKKSADRTEFAIYGLRR